MSQLNTPHQATPPPSPLMLCDRLLALAQDAGRAGLRGTADDLLRLAHTVLDKPPAKARRKPRA